MVQCARRVDLMNDHYDIAYLWQCHTRAHHISVSPPTAECALTCDIFFQRSRSWVMVFSQLMVCLDYSHIVAPPFRLPSVASFTFYHPFKGNFGEARLGSLDVSIQFQNFTLNDQFYWYEFGCLVEFFKRNIWSKSLWLVMNLITWFWILLLFLWSS